jgi:hypothetical protein
VRFEGWHGFAGNHPFMISEKFSVADNKHTANPPPREEFIDTYPRMQLYMNGVFFFVSAATTTADDQ